MSKLDIAYQEQVSFNESAQVRVCKGTIHQGQVPVAIKETYHQALAQANLALQEAMHQAKLTHEHIAKIYDCCMEETSDHRIKSLLVLEWLGSDVGQEIIQRRNSQCGWSEYELFVYLKDIVSALAFAEAKGVSHQDVKPENLFIFQGVIKLGNFGSSMDYLQSSALYGQGSPCYLSPELRQAVAGGRKPDSSPYISDVYSLGLTFLHMALLEPPTEMMVIGATMGKTEEVLARVGFPTLKQILWWMLAIEPSQRATFTQLFEYFSNWENTQGSECGTQGESIQPAVVLPADPNTFQQGYDPNSYEPGYTGAVQPLQTVSQPSNGGGGPSELDQSSAVHRTSAQFYGNPQGQVACVVCNTPFVVNHSWQSLQEGGQVCSYPCRTYYEQNTGTRCATCQATVTDQSWWAAAAQQYGAYQDHFRTFCSFQCFKNHFPPAKTEPKSLECAGCAVPIHPNKLSETRAIQLTCLHIFHDVNCAYHYMSEINGNFSRRVIVVCPICQTPIAEDILRDVRDEKSRMKQNGQKQEHAGKQESNPRSSGKFDAPVNVRCYKCSKEPASQLFDCGHNICSKCKISVCFVWFKCPICTRR